MEKRLACLLSKKWYMDYSEMVGFIHSHMPPALVRYKNLLIKEHKSNQAILG